VEGDVMSKEEGKNRAAPSDDPVDGQAWSDHGGVRVVGEEPFEDTVGAYSGFLVSDVSGIKFVCVACATEDEGVCMSGERGCLRGWKRSGLDGGCGKRIGSSE